jgi:hypothetical protein
MKNYFFRIVNCGVNINGNCKHRIYGYKRIDIAENAFNYISIQDMEKIDLGRMYRKEHFILTLAENKHILERLTAAFGDDYNYIFEY